MTRYINQLRAVRESQKMTRNDLSREMSLRGHFVNIATIRRWERGTHFPHPSNLRTLCEILGKTDQELGIIRSSPLKDSEKPMTQLTPFRFRRPPEDESEIFGRKGLRSRLLNHTSGGGSVAILDPGSYGKTWLIQGFKLAANKQDDMSHMLIVQVNAKSPRCNESVVHFTQRILEGLQIALTEKQSGPQKLLVQESIGEIENFTPSLIREPLITLDKVVELLKAKGFLVVLCIDDIDGLGKKPAIFDVNFFRALRAFNQQYSLAYIITTRQISLFQAIGKDAELSNFPTIFDIVRLKPFNVEETRAFIESHSTLVHFSQEEQALLWQYGKIGEQQWSPQLLQRIGRELYELKSSPSITPTDSYYWQQVAEHLQELLASEE